MSFSPETYALCKKYTKEFCEQYVLPGQAGAVEMSASWEGNGPYTQVVTIEDYEVTEKTRIDLLISAAVYEQMMQDSVEVIYICNEDGVLTAVAEGGCPSAAMTVPAIYQEVV
jgi:hypothetical protein